MRDRLALLVLVSGAAAPGAAGQGSVIPVPIDSGTLVRMTPQVGAPFEGRLIQPIRPDATLLHACRYPGQACTDPADSAAIRRIPVSSLLRLEVQRGSHAGSGALLGGVIGVALGLLGESIGRGLCETQDCLASANTAPLRVGVIGAALGALFGWASPRWGQP